MAVIVWMSTETFSFQATSSVTKEILIFLYPDIPYESLNSIHQFIRKAAHVTEYFILSLLLLRAFHGSSFRRTRRQSLLTLLIVVLWAAGDELHQAFVPERTASVIDVMIDTGGALLGLVVSAIWHRCRKEK